MHLKRKKNRKKERERDNITRQGKRKAAVQEEWGRRESERGVGGKRETPEGRGGVGSF